MLVLVRLVGEMGTKSKPVRSRFLKRLQRNIGDALRKNGIEHRIENHWSRLILEVSDVGALDVLQRIFGIRAVSLIEHQTPPNLEELVRVGAAAYAEVVSGKTFAVAANRSGPHAFSSQDVCLQLGAALRPHALGVNIKNPQVKIHVELRPKVALLYRGEAEGAGGLPLGTGGHAVALISGGYDSAVAAWRTMRRGVELTYVFCNLAGAAYERTVVQVVKTLTEQWSAGSFPRLHVIDFAPIVTNLKQQVAPKYVQVVLKRLMYRAATQVAEQVRADAIVTGESIGQVASQTLANLRAIEVVTPLPVIRPLASDGKDQIMREARYIGTYSLSEHLQEYCALVEEKPSTASRVNRVDKQEAGVDLALLERLVAERKVIDIGSLDADDLMFPYLYTEEIPSGAQVLDIRTDYEFEAWHYPGAKHIEFTALIGSTAKLPKEQKYVVYCGAGMQSALAAEKLQRKGYEAYSFKGGTRALRRYAG